MQSDPAPLEIAIQGARAAGERLLALFGNAAVRQKGTTQDLVTEADVAAEEAVFEIVTQAFPDHKFLREEGESTGGSEDDHLWVIDPLDATNNYAHGIPHFSVSVAYVQRGIPMAGVVLDPLRNELFSAARGHGAFLNNKEIKVAEHAEISDCIFGTGFYYDRGELMRRTLGAIDALFTKNMRGVRRMGSAAIDLAWVACGRYDGFFEYQLKPWDYAAGWLLIEEAGGKCFDRVGNPMHLDACNIIAANPHVAEELVTTVKW